MPIVDPLPTPLFRFTAAQFDDEPTFAQARAVAWTVSGGSITGADITSQVFVAAVLPGLALAIQKCFYLDLSGAVDPEGFDVDGGPAPIKVTLQTTAADEPTGVAIKVGISAPVIYSLGEAWSLAALLNAAGFGTPYSP